MSTERLSGIKSIRELELDAQRLFLRVDFNVPMEGTTITDDSRIKQALPTIKYAMEKGARVILASHLGRPKGAPETQRIGSIEHMHVVYADPQAGVLRMTGGLGPLQQDAAGGTLTVTLSPAGTPAGEGTRIDWTYVVSGLVVLKPQEIAPLVDKVLGEQFERLAARSAAPAQADDPAKLRD